MDKRPMSELPTEEIGSKLAILEMTGVGINKCVQILKDQYDYPFTRGQLKYLQQKEAYIRTVKEYKDNLVKKAVTELKAGTSRLVPKILQAIEKALDEGNIQAIPHALKVLGVENVEPENKQAQSITVVLPGSNKTKDITLIKDDDDEVGQG